MKKTKRHRVALDELTTLTIWQMADKENRSFQGQIRALVDEAMETRREMAANGQRKESSGVQEQAIPVETAAKSIAGQTVAIGGQMALPHTGINEPRIVRGKRKTA